MVTTFYATFGCGQPGYPGYLKVSVETNDSIAGSLSAELVARRRVNEATGGKWCGLYRSLEDLHIGDRIYRGEA